MNLEANVPFYTEKSPVNLRDSTRGKLKCWFGLSPVNVRRPKQLFSVLFHFKTNVAFRDGSCLVVKLMYSFGIQATNFT